MPFTRSLVTQPLTCVPSLISPGVTRTFWPTSVEPDSQTVGCDFKALRSHQNKLKECSWWFAFHKSGFAVEMLPRCSHGMQQERCFCSLSSLIPTVKFAFFSWNIMRWCPAQNFTVILTWFGVILLALRRRTCYSQSLLVCCCGNLAGSAAAGLSCLCKFSETPNKSAFK